MKLIRTAVFFSLFLMLFAHFKGFTALCDFHFIYFVDDVPFRIYENQMGHQPRGGQHARFFDALCPPA